MTLTKVLCLRSRGCGSVSWLGVVGGGVGGGGWGINRVNKIQKTFSSKEHAAQNK